MNEISTTVVSQIVEYNPIAAALASVEKYRGLVCDVKTPTGMAEAKAAHREVAALRIALDKTRKQVKADVLARGKLIDGEANRILDLIAAIEDPIKTQIEAEERREEEARQAAILAEQQRLEAVERERKEAEERRLADERAKLNRERAEFEQKQAEARAREEQARKERQAEDDRLAAERRKLEDAQRAQRDAEDLKRRDEQRVREEAEAALRARARAEQEKREAAEREELRKMAELFNADSLLTEFVERFGHLKRFNAVVRAIKALPAAKPAKRAA